MYQCLCCGCYTLPAPADCAIAFICPVCVWENDVFLTGDDEPSDENHGVTLRRARAAYQKYGVCELRKKPYSRSPEDDELPKKKWV